MEVTHLNNLGWGAARAAWPPRRYFTAPLLAAQAPYILSDCMELTCHRCAREDVKQQLASPATSRCHFICSLWLSAPDTPPHSACARAPHIAVAR